jgi:hypothetical protein
MENALFPANKLNSECILCFGVPFSNHSSVGAKNKTFFHSCVYERKLQESAKCTGMLKTIKLQNSIKVLPDYNQEYFFVFLTMNGKSNFVNSKQI